MRWISQCFHLIDFETSFSGSSLFFSNTSIIRKRGKNRRRKNMISLYNGDRENPLFPSLSDRKREREREREKKRERFSRYKLSSDTKHRLHHIHNTRSSIFYPTKNTTMIALNMSMMVVGLVITTLCVFTAKGNEEKVSTTRFHCSFFGQY